MNVIKVHYIKIRKCPNEMHYFVQFILKILAVAVLLDSSGGEAINEIFCGCVCSPSDQCCVFPVFSILTLEFKTSRWFLNFTV
jgi:hypothetical protein